PAGPPDHREGRPRSTHRDPPLPWPGPGSPHGRGAQADAPPPGASPGRWFGRRQREAPGTSAAGRLRPAPVGQDPLDAGRLRQGAIVWIHPEDAPEVVPTHPHPHVIVQDDLFNRSRITTVVVCALTSNLRRADEPGNILLEPGEGGLPRQS